MKLITEGWETPGNELAFCICVVSRTECVLLNSFWRGINNYAFARGKLREQKLLGGPTFSHLPLCFQKISKSFILNQFIYSTLIQKAQGTMPLAFCWNICWISLKSALYICNTQRAHKTQAKPHHLIKGITVLHSGGPDFQITVQWMQIDSE